MGWEFFVPAQTLIGKAVNNHFLPNFFCIPELNDETESVMKFVREASFDKKEFKRNLAGSGF